MPRHGGSNGVRFTTKQKGKSLKGKQPGAYARLHKARHADRYDRPYIEGTYKSKEEL